MFWPRAEDADFYYTMGMDLDLDVAMRNATQETVRYLQETRGLSAADAYSLASIAHRLPHRRGGRRRAAGLRRDPEEDLQDQSGVLVQALRVGGAAGRLSPLAGEVGAGRRVRELQLAVSLPLTPTLSP